LLNFGFSGFVLELRFLVTCEVVFVGGYFLLLLGEFFCFLLILRGFGFWVFCLFLPSFLSAGKAFKERTHGQVGQGKALTHHKHQRENAGCAEARKKSCPGSPLKVNPTFFSSKFAPNPAFSLQE
jgi:hypothetical protein